ncbi:MULTISPECIES: ATP synthase subunit I [Halomonadaceae]|uniref:ATP synthase subunit I n=1 Tax=Halomonadaceae TaxID=28256 RepID=UPI001582A404|nr:ATP synthase subunit I [Halomonas sp. BMC7]MDI4636387.1 ATP synthase subunit I [Halomonas sp. BMC7]NUJ60751.1 ATP synthase subunit I [Halomonas taeanensis]
MAAKLKRPPIARLLVAQSLMLAVVSALGMLAAGIGGAVSALTGSGVALLPNAYFAWRAFRFQHARHYRQMVNGFYRAEAGKFGLTVALFTIVFVTVPPSNPAFFFGAYVATLLVHWLGPWLLRRPSHT